MKMTKKKNDQDFLNQVLDVSDEIADSITKSIKFTLELKDWDSIDVFWCACIALSKAIEKLGSYCQVEDENSEERDIEFNEILGCIKKLHYMKQSKKYAAQNE